MGTTELELMKPQGMVGRNGGSLATLRSAAIPQTYEDMVALATGFAKSGMFGEISAVQALTKIVIGAEYGLLPGQAMRGLYLVKGRVAMETWLMVALIRNHPDCEYFRCKSSTTEAATYETKRKSNSLAQERSFTLGDAKNMGLLSKAGPWTQGAAQDMLEYRAMSRLAKKVWQDVLGGVSTPDEVHEVIQNEQSIGLLESPQAVVAEPVPTKGTEGVKAKLKAQQSPPGPVDASSAARVVTPPVKSMSVPMTVVIAGTDGPPTETDPFDEPQQQGLGLDVEPVNPEAPGYGKD